MKKILTLSAALMLCASMAMASGVSLNINDCGGGTAIHAATNACTANSGTAMALFGSFIMPAVTKTAFVGAMSIIDIQTNQATIPDWWRADGCRGTGFTIATDAGNTGASCSGLWDAVAVAGNNLTALPGVGGPARIRFLLGAVLSSGNAYDLVGDDATEQTVFKLSVLKLKSTGTGSCAGCTAGACVVLNDVQLQGLNDTSASQYIDVTGPYLGALDYVTYNAGAPACNASTPANNRTWGSVKALYR